MAYGWYSAVLSHGHDVDSDPEAEKGHPPPIACAVAPAGNSPRESHGKDFSLRSNNLWGWSINVFNWEKCLYIGNWWELSSTMLDIRESFWPRKQTDWMTNSAPKVRQKKMYIRCFDLLRVGGFGSTYLETACYHHLPFMCHHLPFHIFHDLLWYSSCLQNHG